MAGNHGEVARRTDSPIDILMVRYNAAHRGAERDVFPLLPGGSDFRFDDYDARQAAYWSLLAGACGHTYGNNNVWQMWAPGRKPVIWAHVPWYEALDHPGGKVRHVEVGLDHDLPGRYGDFLRSCWQ